MFQNLFNVFIVKLKQISHIGVSFVDFDWWYAAWVSLSITQIWNFKISAIIEKTLFLFD